MVGESIQQTRLSLSHDFIELFQKSKHRIFSIVGPLYSEGHSLNDMVKMTGIPYSTINQVLRKNGVQMRPKGSVSSKQIFQQKIKSSTPPPFGFTYLGGQLEKDSKEYPTLLVIYQQWRLRQTASAIVRHMNSKGFKTRQLKSWSRTAICNIMKRFEDGTININKEK
jgi:hypothetical protein